MRVAIISILFGILPTSCTFNAPGLSLEPSSDGLSGAIDAASQDQTDIGPVRDQSCIDGFFICVGDSSHKCNPADGTYYLDRPCPLGCKPTEGVCYSFEPSSNAGALLTDGTEDISISDQTITLNTSDRSVSPANQLIDSAFSCPDQSFCYLTVHVLYINGNGGLRIEGSRPLVIIANSNIVIDGLISVNGSGQTPGSGGAPGGSAGEDGQGCGGGTTSGMEGILPSIRGGAGGSFGGTGGQGGGDGPKGKPPCDDLCPAPLAGALIRGGSGGGGGDSLAGGNGGGGGGAIQLTAMETISISGIITAAGGGGAGGDYSGSGGGGGSGGGIVIEAPQVEISGIVTANGGGGGSGALLTSQGEDGQNGAPSFLAAEGGTGPSYQIITEYKGGDGGRGSDRDITEGSPGVLGTETGRHGGGGGGAGRLCFRTRDGTIIGVNQLSPWGQSADIVRFRELPKL